jgi:hypothetical protein
MVSHHTLLTTLPGVVQYTVSTKYTIVPNGSLFPLKCTTFDQGPWGSSALHLTRAHGVVVHYIGNRVPFETPIQDTVLVSLQTSSRVCPLVGLWMFSLSSSLSVDVSSVCGCLVCPLVCLWMFSLSSSGSMDV